MPLKDVCGSPADRHQPTFPGFSGILLRVPGQLPSALPLVPHLEGP